MKKKYIEQFHSCIVEFSKDNIDPPSTDYFNGFIYSLQMVFQQMRINKDLLYHLPHLVEMVCTHEKDEVTKRDILTGLEMATRLYTELHIYIEELGKLFSIVDESYYTIYSK